MNLTTMKKYISILIVLCFLSCNEDKEIVDLLSSHNTTDIIKGAKMAADTQHTKYVPLLLDNSFNASISTNLFFKGISVYEGKMNALRRLLKSSPPKEITFEPDSTIIKYYTKLAESRNLLSKK